VSATCFEQVADKSETKICCRLVRNVIDLSGHVEIDLAGVRHVSNFLFVENRFQAGLKQWNFRNDRRTDFSRQSTNPKRDSDDAVTDVIAIVLAFSVENLINCTQNERVVWDLHADFSEEDIRIGLLQSCQ